MTRAPILGLRSVTRRFGPVTAVDSVDLDVERGEFLTLLGPSGSGKSTLLMMIAGFERTDSGEIHLDGVAQRDIPAYKRGIGVVFQSYAVFPHLSVFENVAFPLRNRGWTEADIRGRVEELLELVRLDGMGSRWPNQLSGGQQQRVALARALSFNPPLLLLDEPLGALDKRLRDHMLAEFRRIHRALGTTMLFVTHDQDEALAMSDRIAVMDRGRIVQLGRPRAIYERPANNFAAGFVGDANLLSGITMPDGIVRLEGGWDVRCGHEVAEGQPVNLLVRPEHLLPGAPANPIQAEVEERLYLGHTTRYVLRAVNGLLLQMRVTNRFDTPDLEIGAKISVGFEPGCACLLTK
ncbi:ABC transporter ATP-binding protein [Bosea sp. (in: a-proteobacteria)]|uniref:ABC transporter ATP-binding protein n=1 Tax=Bosea sp. (in: a-proteobacteria) TaxID=1871050 RepID=UPI00260886AE|nr:ABC transporter ATP-binding protein [Bosea sp. (in: a-proteobacteria)]MCO5089778.1 ABC transporter ATP-binding protein [Bosea sp. (in: a-proteobacteria)]